MKVNTVHQPVKHYQSSSGIVAATAWKTTAARVGDEAGESQADGAGQQYGGVGPLHHPMKHKRLSRETMSVQKMDEAVADLMLFLHFTQIAVCNPGLTDRHHEYLYQFSWQSAQQL